MKNIGFKVGSIVAFLALTAWYLFPTVQLSLMQRYADDLPQAELELYIQENGARMQQLSERALSLGLDLKGGMHVAMEVGTPDLLRELSAEFGDAELDQLIESAYQASVQNRSDFIDEFYAGFQAQNPDGLLSRYFRSDAAGIDRRSTNDEIIVYLRNQRNAAVDRAIEIIRTRVDRFGVTEPSILKQGQDRIVVELPGVDEKERVRNLLKGTARLEFRLAADADELNASRNQIYEYFQPTEGDTTQTTNALAQILVGQTGNAYVFGFAMDSDRDQVDQLLGADAVQRLLPRNTTLLWASSSFFTDDQGNDYYELIGAREEIELTGDVISEASVAFDPTTNIPEVSMTMNTEGARKWSRITGANIGKPVAIVLDNFVYSYPVVQNKISNGRSSITGLSGISEAEDLVNILLSGALPAPLEIIEERTVGATLGEASIQAGLYSTLIGLGIVALFMMVYYRAGGGVADLALLLNIIFILGILAAFRATLTLPGIAGIVLTIGMAVDANVLIFDRIREEMRHGKTLRAAIDSGYANAVSAIMDANITTFFVGVILYSFGVGPIKGFAVTLMAGIVSSLFSALIITRALVDYLTRDKSADISFG